jgi:anti-anti-sigma factor
MSEYQSRHVESRIEQGVVVLTMTSPYLLSDSAARELRDELLNTAIRPEARRIVLDLQNSKSISSSGLAILISLVNKLRETGGQLVLCGLSHEFMSVIKVSSLHTLFRVQPDVPAAIAELNSWSLDLRKRIGQVKSNDEDRERLFMRSFDMLIAISLDMFCIADFDGYFKLLNPAWRETLGFAQGELEAEPYLEFVHPEDREATRAAAEKLTTGADVVSFENRYRCSDGSYKWLSWNAVSLPDVRLIYAVARDVTERKQLERRRAAEHAVTRVLAESARLGEALPEILKAICECLEWAVGLFWTLDRPNRVLKCAEVWLAPSVQVLEFEVINRQVVFEKDVGLPGRVWSSNQPVWIPDVANDTNFPGTPIAAINERLHGGFGIPIESGSIFLGVMGFFSHETREPDEDLKEMMASIGRQIGLFMERKRAETELERQKEELQAIVENIPIMLFIKDAERLCFERVNKAAEELMGYAREELIGMSDYDFFSKEEADFFTEKDRDVLNSKELLDVPEESFTMNHRLRIMHTKKIPLVDEQGIPRHLLGISEDITERKQVEETKRILLHEQGHLMERAEPVLEKISKLGQKVPQLYSQLAIPLRRLRTIVYKAKADARTTLNFLRPPGEPTWDDLQPCNEAIRDWFAELHWLVFNADLQLAFGEQLPDEPLFWAKRDEVLFSLGNLETNAEKAFKRKAEGHNLIAFSARIRTLEENKINGADPAYVVLSVADNGEGIPSEIEDQFFKGRIVTGRSGHGLGSQIIRRVMDNHRGLVRFTTRPQVGTLVELWFPLLVDSHEIPLHDQWMTYERIRKDVGPVRHIGEECLLVALRRHSPL